MQACRFRVCDTTLAEDGLQEAIVLRYFVELHLRYSPEELKRLQLAHQIDELPLAPLLLQL